MLAYLNINSAALPTTAASAGAVANPDTYNSVLPCTAAPCETLTVSDAAKGVIANDIYVYGVKVMSPPTHASLTLNADGTFGYYPTAESPRTDSFSYLRYCATARLA